MRDFKEASIIIKKRVGERFRELRERAGFGSARAAADALGVSANTVGELERGENWLSPEIAARAVVAFNVPFSALFGDQRPLPPTPQEALAVLERELTARRPAPPDADPITARLARVLEDPGARKGLEIWLEGAEQALVSEQKTPKRDRNLPEKGK